ncbi:cobalamin biosynthesis protein CbiX [Duganella sp. BJB488]|uniref:sirohydrochlorin chelatase n=1 Tax=unclassified Duganella TaxID=2636909 RepID=UPI000E35556E|nr:MULTISPECIES: CbiX/SirB N-terminal domain-containing protein [unclassified Duganella]RFP12322.1 cobalamin biosynthesis protein CbiX [Duganella sp. BJB489]RFP16583.1 cobalamin biosynthesis protein CbiX [Duganella sp. BJB488]RFP30686.1 cobalamin biosynthesis protein CbiX [Duganella sp. BJB480]
MTKQALILFAHGARAASWAAPFERLRELTQARTPGVRVSLAFLELMTPQLPALVAELTADGITQITVVPVFLGQGGHVLRDLPLMIDQLRIDHPQVGIDVVEAAGENAAVLNALADYCVASLSAQAAPD